MENPSDTEEREEPERPRFSAPPRSSEGPPATPPPAPRSQPAPAPSPPSPGSQPQPAAPQQPSSAQPAPATPPPAAEPIPPSPPPRPPEDIGAELHDPPTQSELDSAAPKPGVLRRERPITRGDVYAHKVVRGREVPDTPWRRALEKIRELLTSQGERDEQAIEARLDALPGVSRSNTIAVVSPKGGVGKTTTTFLIGNLLASRVKTRVVAVDANPDFGTLAALAPDSVRSEQSLADLLPNLDEIQAGPELRPYMSCLPTGMHLLAAPAEAEIMAVIGAEGYERLLSLLSRFYDVVLLDLGTGITGPVSQWAVARADQLVVITTPEWVTSANVSGALRHLPMEDATLVLNQAGRNAIDREAVEEHFRKQWLERRVTIPYDQQLRLMLDSGTYELFSLSRKTRLSIKQLGVAVGESLE